MILGHYSVELADEGVADFMNSPWNLRGLSQKTIPTLEEAREEAREKRLGHSFLSPAMAAP